MSIKLMSAIFETEFRDLIDQEGNVTKASTAKLVCLALADHANDEGEGAYPGLTKMERKTALSRQGIINTYDALKYNGVIFLQGESKFGTNNYTINKDAFPHSEEGSQPTLLVKPLDHPSKATLPPLVKPLDLNHPLTVPKTSSAATPQKRGDILDGIIDLTFKPKAIREAFAQHFKLTPNWEAKYNRQFLEWAVENQMTPEQVQLAADLWRKDRRFNWAAPTLKGVQEHWLELVSSKKTDETRPEYQPYNDARANLEFVPNPKAAK